MDESRKQRARLQARWKELDAQAAPLKRAAGVLARVTRLLASDAGYDSLKRAERELKKLDELELEAGDLLERARELARETRAWIENEWVRRSGHIVEELEREFQRREIPLERREPGVAGAVELYRFPVTIRLLPARQRAELLHAGERIKGKLPFSASRLYQEWERTRKKLENRATDPDIFADELRQAYRVLEKLGRLKGAGRARLTDLNFQVFVGRQSMRGALVDPSKANLKEYPRWLFAYDLGRLLDDQNENEAWNRYSDLKFVAATRRASSSRAESVTVERESGWVEVYTALVVQ